MKTNALLVPPRAASNPDIRGIKAPVKIFALESFLLWLALLIAFTAIAGWIWRRSRRQQTAATPAVPSLSAEEKAWRALERALAFLDHPKEFCTLVSDAIRAYIEERFDLHAPERTTEEFLEEIQSSAFLSFEQKRLLGDFLARCDLAKFARDEPAQDDLKQLYQVALRLLRETHLPPTAPAPLSRRDSRPAERTAAK